MFQCFLYDSEEFLTEFLNFSKLKSKEPNFFGETNSAENLNYLVPSSVFQFQSFQGPNFVATH